MSTDTLHISFFHTFDKWSFNIFSSNLKLVLLNTILLHFVKVSSIINLKRQSIMENKNVKTASKPWIIIGFILSVFGGITGLGIFIGTNYAWFGNYDKETKQLGWTMIVLGVISAVIWTIALNS